MISGNSSQLVSIQFIAEQVKVFNITVEGLNTYHVGRSGILVHNKAMKSSLVTRFGATVTANGALKNAIDRVKSVFSGNGLIQQGDASAKRAHKLLLDNRFQKKINKK